MCFEYDALPPDLPAAFSMNFAADSGGSSTPTGEELTLTSADGTQFSAYFSRAGAPGGAGIVILPDVRGLFGFYIELAHRFATAGVQAVVIDYFGRTAGQGVRDADFDYMPHVQQTQAQTVAADVAAAIAYLRQLSANAPRNIFTVGFCFGGAKSFLEATQKQGLSGVIGFYGMPHVARLGGPAPIDVVNEFECPVLGLFGSADAATPVEEAHRFDEALTNAGVEHEIIIYPDAPHSFFDKRFDEYKEASDDSWTRMLNFIGRHTTPAANG